MQFPTSICQLISEYSAIYKIDSRLENIDDCARKSLSVNYNAWDLFQADDRKFKWTQLEQNPGIEFVNYVKSMQNIRYCDLSSNTNPAALELLSTRPEEANRHKLSSNPAAIKYLLANPKIIDWSWLSRNPNPLAISMLKANPSKINWSLLSSNHSPEAVEMLKANPSLIAKFSFSANPFAVDYLKENPSLIYWPGLSMNPNAIDLIKSNPDKIDWTFITSNPNAIEFLDEILAREYSPGEYVYQHPNIFKPKVVDYHLDALLELQF